MLAHFICTFVCGPASGLNFKIRSSGKDAIIIMEETMTAKHGVSSASFANLHALCN